MASTSSSSSSVPPRKGCTYDVFLSFRGEDTRNNFVDHLFDALIRNGIHTFKDDKMLGGGQPISEELVKAIKESRFAIVVFSKNYANSSWCLEELSEIMECHHQMGQKVLPVFYHIDPSDVRGQKRDFATAFETHEDRFSGEMDKVNKWRDALRAAASLSGQHILPHNGQGEAAFIRKIVQEIFADIQPRGGSRENHLIGIEPHIDKLISLMTMEATEEVHIVGICGMGGIGKTTIAWALFKRIAYKFEGSSFVKNVRENSKKNICALQEKILNDILGARHEFKIQDPEDGAEMIQERCCRKKVFLVVDDVDDDKQLEFLAAEREWFGPGSRIIITTRDHHLLSYANANDRYNPALLRTDQALELFSRHAFRKSSPPDGYMDLSKRAITYACRLPLALKVLGSFLCGREAGVWGSALNRLAKTQSVEVLDTLKLSFDYLSDLDKQIFLDIACFYKGKDVKDVTRILDSFGFDPVIGISVLVEKCLIIVSSNNTLEMHDLIQEMGWKVVQESAPNSRLCQLQKIHNLIGKRKKPNSWLWHLEKMHDLIRKTKIGELEVIEGIVVAREDIEQGFGFGPRVFESMKKLRILEVKGYFTWFKPTFLPEELRWFCWRKYPFSSLPPVTHMSKLVGLEMEDGQVKHLWEGKKVMLQNLKFIHLSCCKSLKRFPDVSGAPNIERLNLSWCSDMVEVDESVGSLKKLVKLDMTHCWKLKRLPSMLHMESLETLILRFCHSLERIPEFSPCMVNLSHLHIIRCKRIKEVPSSIKYLSNLSHLDLDCCKSLEKIPNSIWELKCLNTLRLNYCGDGDFPKNLHGLSSLEELHIFNNNKLIQLPESISHLSSLKHLRLDSCKRLKTIHGLPSGIQVLMVEDCESLEKIEDLSQKYQCLSKIQIKRCPKLRKDEENERYLDKMLEPSFLEKWAAVDGCLSISIPGSNIPSWFKAQQDGRQIALKLPPTWQTKIAGFAVCCVLTNQISVFFREVPGIKLRFENDGMFVPKSKAGDTNNETEEATNVNTWISYIPFSLFEQLHHKDNGNDFEGEDWFHMTEGNLVFEFSKWFGIDVKRCGAKVVYGEDVASIQQTKPSVFSYYWSWKLTNEFDNSILCKDE